MVYNANTICFITEAFSRTYTKIKKATLMGSPDLKESIHLFFKNKSSRHTGASGNLVLFICLVLTRAHFSTVTANFLCPLEPISACKSSTILNDL